jgi:hypothetical protein
MKIYLVLTLSITKQKHLVTRAPQIQWKQKTQYIFQQIQLFFLSFNVSAYPIEGILTDFLVAYAE